MNVYYFELTAQDRDKIRQKLAGEQIVLIEGPLTNAAQAKEIADAEIVSVFVHSHIGPDVLDELPNLKLIATRSTGFDHIDISAAQSRGILVCNVPTYGENTVAEHTFALILALSRNVLKAYTQAATREFAIDELQGFDLKGKTIGVIGTGHIGLHVIRIAKAFDMEVLAYDPYRNDEAADLLGFKYKGLVEVLRNSDIVTLHSPLTKDNHHMIGEQTLKEFKTGAILINTARGGLVDTEALLQALDDGQLAAVGLDVFEGEEVISEEKQLLRNKDASRESLKLALINRELLRRRDMVVTPHIAYDSQEAVERILDTTAENIRAFIAGAPRNQVHT
jgi:D-lactate dehydrogenase